METKLMASGLQLKDADRGEVVAAFSTFNIVDRDGDVVLPSALPDGTAVPMVWAHDWSKPIGKGTIRVEQSRALWNGKLFLDTEAGREAFATIKNMGELLQYSWGFRVTAWEKGERDGRSVRIIKGTEVFEVSPVLIGANSSTYTVSAKDGCRRQPDMRELRQRNIELRHHLVLIDLYSVGALSADELFLEDVKLFQRRARRELVRA